MTTKSMTVRTTGQLMLIVHPSRPPTTQEWDAFIQLSLAKLAQGPLKMLVMTQGGAPDARQRTQSRLLFEKGPLPIAVLTDLPVVRGVVTALSWFNPAIRAFAFKRGAGIGDALKFLQVDAVAPDRVLVEIREMQREVGADVDS
jgi:hypothetical protein